MLEYIMSMLHNPNTAVNIAFLLAFIESLPFIGSLFPGMLTMPPIGWLIAKQTIPVTSTLSLILIGGMLGDYVGYFLGVFGKHMIRKKTTPAKSTCWLTQGEYFVKKYGPLSIIIGRFIGPFRSSVPLFAGIFGMRFTHFTLAAIPSVFLWAIIHLAPGALMAWFNFDILLYLQKIMLYITCIIPLALLLIASHGKQCPGLNLLYKLFTSIWVSLGITKQASPLITQTLFASLSTASMVYLTLTNHFDLINHTIYQYISGKNAFIIQLALTYNAVCYIPFILVLTVICASIQWKKQQYQQSLQLFLSVGCAFTLCFILKYIIHYPRPEHIAYLLGNQSLPSGHSCLATVFILNFQPAQKKKRWQQVLNSVYIIIAMASRVVIGAHWISDVLLGWEIGYLSTLTVRLIILHFDIRNIYNITTQKTISLQAHKAGFILSQKHILISYCIISVLYAAIANKLTITPYLL